MIIIFDRNYEIHIVDSISSTKIHTKCGELLHKSFGINTLGLDLGIDNICKICQKFYKKYNVNKYDINAIRNNSLENNIEYYIYDFSSPSFKFLKCFSKENRKLNNIFRKLGRRKLGYLL